MIKAFLTGRLFLSIDDLVSLCLWKGSNNRRMSHHSSYICQKDAQYAAIERELSALSPDDVSAMVAAKLRRVILNKSSRPPMPLDEPVPVMPLLVTSSTLAKLADECAFHSIKIDHRSFMEQQQKAGHHDSSSAVNEEKFLWRCSLCSISLLEKPIYSCAAPMRVSIDQPLERFHHFCVDCHHTLRRCHTMSSSSEKQPPSCPRCNRIVPGERNVVAEAAMQAATSDTITLT